MSQSNFKQFGFACKAAREHHSLTVEQAVDLINNSCRESICTERSLMRWENGENLPKIEPTLAMAKAYRRPELIPLRIEAIELATKEKSPTLTRRRKAV